VVVIAANLASGEMADVALPALAHASGSRSSGGRGLTQISGPLGVAIVVCAH
jgi:hypothetical protein